MMVDAAAPFDGLGEGLSARNLLVTVFGDAVLPHGVSCSVRSLTALLAPLGVSERLVRTSLTRLVNDGVLHTSSVNRRSFYGVHPDALGRFARADARIYGPLHPSWDGSWTLVVIDASEGSARQRTLLRQELGWAGLGVVAPNVMASPVIDATVAADVVASVGGFERVLVSRSRIVAGTATIDGEQLARRCAPLDETAERYRRFVDEFAPRRGRSARWSPAEAFAFRIVLVAAYRRIVLTDPVLPAELLPVDWIGDRARRTVADLYSEIGDRSERHFVEAIETHGEAISRRIELSGRFSPPGQAS